MNDQGQYTNVNMERALKKELSKRMSKPADQKEIATIQVQNPQNVHLKNEHTLDETQTKRDQQSHLDISREIQMIKLGTLPFEKDEEVHLNCKKPLKNSFIFWLMVNHAAFTDFILAYNIGLFNTLADHMNYIYGWTEEEKTLHYSLINSLPQAVAAIVSLFAGTLAARYGRRKILIILFWIGILGNSITLIASTEALQIGRLIIGVCFGGWSSIGSLYAIEIAPKQYKGLSGIIYSLYFGIGILVAFLAGYGLPSSPAESATNSYWRFMLGFPIVLCLLSIGLFTFLFKDETAPYIMIQNNDEQATKRVLNKYFVEEVAQDELIDLTRFAKNIESSRVGWKQLFGPIYKSRVIMIAVFTIAFSYVGCNAINVYSFNIIKSVEGKSTAQFFTTIMPIGDIIGPIFANFLLERLGRKSLYLVGLTICSLIISGFCVVGWTNESTYQKFFILIYKLIFSSSIAPVHWIYPNEILPPVGVGFFNFCYWTASLSTVQSLPYLLSSFGTEITLAIFPIVTTLATVYLCFTMKETTGKGKEQIENMFKFGSGKGKEHKYNQFSNKEHVTIDK